MFQSLSRDSGRLNRYRYGDPRKGSSVSIPQSGFGAFELLACWRKRRRWWLFQSLSRDSGRLNQRSQSGGWRGGSRFQSLSRDSGRLNSWRRCSSYWTIRGFQSLSRDSGRLNSPGAFAVGAVRCSVSIPQSGFGAFERRGRNSGLRRAQLFQSLSRDSGRLNQIATRAKNQKYPRFNPSVGIRGV
mgnify:CR=1 FL=1